MTKNINIKLFIFIFLIVDFLIVSLFSTTLSISFDEANTLFNQKNYLHYIITFSIWLFGQNDFGLRFAFIFLHILNALLLLFLSKDIVKKQSDLLLILLIYLLIPGLNSAALIVNKTEILLFFTLLFLILYQKNKTVSYIVLLFISFLDIAFIHMLIGLSFYGYYKKNKNLAIVSLIGIIISYGVFGYDFGGIPRGYFLDIFGMYGAIFSLLYFIFYIYSLYWMMLKYPLKLPMIWFISANTFIISIVLSLRQFIAIENFAPFLIVFIPYTVYIFFNSYRIRLPQFRKKHKVFLFVTLLIMLTNTIFTYFNKPFYLFYDNPKAHFAYKFHFAKEIAKALKEHHINGIKTNAKLQMRLRFYNIKEDKKYILSTTKTSSSLFAIPFKIFKKPIITYYVSLKG